MNGDAMNIWMSGEIQDDVGDAFRQARNGVEQTINSDLSQRDYGPSVQKWALIPIILPREDERWGEIHKYDKRKKVVEFRLKIHHATFKAAASVGQKSMICACLLRSVDLFPRLNVSGFDRLTFRADIERLATANGWIDKSLQSGPVVKQMIGTTADQRIAIGAQLGGPELEASKAASAIDRVKKAAIACQSDFVEGSAPALKVIFCVAGSSAQPDWDHGRVTKYLTEQQRLVVEAAVPKRVAESDSPLDYLIDELYGANALAFEFYRQNGMKYPLAEAEKVVAKIRETASL